MYSINVLDVYSLLFSILRMKRWAQKQTDLWNSDKKKMEMGVRRRILLE